MVDPQAQAPEPVETTEDKAVPYERFQQVTKGRREALARVAELEDQLRTLQAEAGTARTLADSLRDAEGRLSSQAAEWQGERELWRAGLTDPEGIEVARMFYGKLDADKRPTMGEWLASMKADPTSAPRALAAYLAASGAPAPASSAAEPEPPARPAPPNPNRGAASSSAAAAATAQGFDAATIKRLADEARRTGDYSKLREAMPAIRASLR